MKLIIDIPEQVVTAIQNGEDYRYDIYTAIAQGIPLRSVTNAENSEAYSINQEENCKIVREFLHDVINIKDLPVCKECRTCEHCRKKYKQVPKIIWMKDCPFIFCTHHHEHFAPSDTCEFWKGEEEE